MRADQARDEVRGGLLWPGGLLANETTLRQHRDRIAGKYLMTHALARACGYPEAEILDVLGPEDGGAAAPAIDGAALRAGMAAVCDAVDALFDAVPALRDHVDEVAAGIARAVRDRGAPAVGGA